MTECYVYVCMYVVDIFGEMYTYMGNR